ncbi:MAG: hypothetical protein FWB98_08250 [Defluviitaleaceae bacterium]|nr:hypothetical protein [Defluviitaleaceae bacterium]
MNLYRILPGITIGIFIGAVIQGIMIFAGGNTDNIFRIILFATILFGVLCIFLAAIAKNQMRLIQILEQNQQGGGINIEPPTIKVVLTKGAESVINDQN